MSCKRLVLIGLFIGLFALPVFGAAAESVPDDYRAAAENGAYTLYLREDTLSIIIESKATGEQLWSAVRDASKIKGSDTWKGYFGSGIILEYITGETQSGVQADLINSPHEIAYRCTAQGFDADITFTEPGISLTVSLVMDDGGIHVTVPHDSIIEADSAANTLGALILFPFLGNTYLGETAGYMMIPDGQGVLVYLNDKEKRVTTPYVQPIYGSKSGVNPVAIADYSTPIENILMPVYGMVHTDEKIGYLCIIEEGDQAADILAYPNGARTNFNWIAARFTYNMLYKQPLGPSSASVSKRTGARAFDLKLHFLPVEGENAHYAGLASAYRGWLADNGFFGRADAARGYDFRVDFLGLEREKALLGKKDVVMTTFQQAEEILLSLAEAGVSGLSVGYRGWQTGGITAGLPLSSYSPASSLGGAAALNALREKAETLGMRFTLEADFRSLNLQESPTLNYFCMERVTSEEVYETMNGMLYDRMYTLLPEKSLENAKTVVSAARREGLNGLSLAGITSLMTDYKHNGAFYPADTLKASYLALVRSAADQLGVELGAANAYLWREGAALYDLPMHGSGFLMEEEEIPFLSIALSGMIPCYSEYMNFQSDSDKWLLMHIEQGIRPSFLLTWADSVLLRNTNSKNMYSTQYMLFDELIAAWYARLKEVYDAIDGASILRHDRTGACTRVQWSNGTVVYLNYGDADARMDGFDLPQMSYKVVRADE